MKPYNQGKKAQSRAFVLDIMDVLTAPVLTHSVAWKDSIPARLLKVITMDRLITAMKHEELASYAETCAFIMTRTFDAPMTYEWTEIYVHVACTTCEIHFQEDHWDKVKAKRELDDYQKGLLKQLRQWIYHRRREHVKSKIKAEETFFSLAPQQNFDFSTV